jgi:riboflavin synthase
MFTGIIEGTGEIKNIQKYGSEATFTIKVPSFFSDCREGDSVAVEGVCLTITSIKGSFFTLDVSRETLDISTLGDMRQGETVNLEKALRLSDRLGGHLVSGHVDGKGVIEKFKKLQRSFILQVKVEENLGKYLIEKGSVAVDGVSLTINKCTDTSFDVNIIPKTIKETAMMRKKVGDRVNIEADLISKYIEKFLFNDKISITDKGPSRINRAMLDKYGFGGNNGDF